MADHENFTRLLNDLEYLIDELGALMFVIESVPVYDRPGNELSICENIRLISYAQETFFRPLIGSVDARAPDTESIMEGFLQNRLDAKAEMEKGVQHYIGKLSQYRAGLIKDLQKQQKSGSDYGILTAMLRFERNVFKEIAGRILTINKDA